MPFTGCLANGGSYWHMRRWPCPAVEGSSWHMRRWPAALWAPLQPPPLFSNKGPPLSQPQDGQTLLHIVAKGGSLQLIEKFLDMGVDIKALADQVPHRFPFCPPRGAAPHGIPSLTQPRFRHDFIDLIPTIPLTLLARRGGTLCTARKTACNFGRPGSSLPGGPTTTTSSLGVWCVPNGREDPISLGQCLPPSPFPPPPAFAHAYPPCLGPLIIYRPCCPIEMLQFRIVLCNPKLTLPHCCAQAKVCPPLPTHILQSTPNVMLPFPHTPSLLTSTPPFYNHVAA